MKNIFILLFLSLCNAIITAQIIDFPDANFKNALVNTLCVDIDGLSGVDSDADFNDDGEIQIEEALLVKHLYLENNQIKSLEGIEYFKNLISLVCIYNELETLNLSGLNNLRGLGCSNNKLTSLDLTGLDSLLQFYCSNNDLLSLDVSMMNLLSILDCSNNKLKFLISKTGNEFSILRFDENENLEYICCNNSEIEKIKTQVISNGLLNCEVNSYCTFTPGGKFFHLEGKTTFDLNMNECVNQGIEMPNIKFNIFNGTINGSVISNYSGKYTIPVQEGTHTITPVIEKQDFFDINPPSTTITFPSTSDTFMQDFCITPKGVFSQTNITVIPLTPPARPGFDATYKVVWENVGNQIESGTLNFAFKEVLLDYISASKTPDQVAAGILRWDFTDLQPFEKREIVVTFIVNKPTDTPAVNAGDKLYLTASILDNIFTLENTVVGSYDPNDKTCLQGTLVKPDMVGEFVDYLIRFENTGNYPAENVVVKDIINTSMFDVSTLQITDTSHPMYTRIEDNKVEFIFENIQLPFEDDQNDGYVAFKLKSLPSLLLGDSLKNLADIYFDYNFPIRTNEAQTTINNPITLIDVIIETIQVYPNPVNDFLYFDNSRVWKKAQIYDVSGRIVRSLTLVDKQIDVTSLENGSYIVSLRNGAKTGVLKFVKF